MIIIKNKLSIAKMETAGKKLVEIFEDIPSVILPGMTTLELDQWIATQLAEKQLVSKTKGYRGYRHSSCISRNDEVVHGVPCKRSVIQSSDVVKVDICASWRGYCADMARTFVIGSSSSEINKLIQTAHQALNKGIEKAYPGNRLSDISEAIQQAVEGHGFGIIRDFAGHGIGKKMHEDPEILNYGKSGSGPVLRSGMTFAIEPMITLGNYEVYVADDGWTVKTTDKSIAAHVEDTIAITDNGPKILTRSKIFTH